MNKLNINRQTIAVIIFLIVYFLIQFTGLFNFYSYGWDESVYLHMREYILSGGKGGFLENLRPTLFSVMLTPLGDNIFILRLFILILSISTLWIFYFIGRKHLNLKLGWIFPIFLAFFPLYYITSTSILTEIPALFFHAFSIYYLFERRYVSSGIMGFLAFFTRFPFGLYLPILLIGVSLLEKKRDMIKSVFKFILGVLIGSSLFFINIYLFYPETKNLFFAAIYPILNQLKDHALSEYVWYYDKGLLFYPKYLLDWTIFTVFLIVGALFLIRNSLLRFVQQRKNKGLLKKNALVTALMLLPLLYLLITTHKEIRYLMLVIPWVIYFICFGLTETVVLIKQKLSEKNKILTWLVIFALLIICFSNLLMNSVVIIKNFYHDPERLYYNYFFALKDLPFQDKVLTSNPMIKTDARIDIGYYDDEYFYKKLSQNRYDYIYYNHDWFPCRKNDVKCLKLRENTEDYLKDNYRLYLNYSLYNSDFLIYSDIIKDPSLNSDNHAD